MVSVDLACGAIRLTPVWVCIIAYCPKGVWPTPFQALVRVMDYGFSVDSFKTKPIVLLTHMFVHANDSHLFGNITSLTATFIEFGGPSIRENMEERSITKSIIRTVGSFVVLITGGIIGGIGGQLLYNDVRLKKRYNKWSAIYPTIKDSSSSSLVSPLDAVVARVRNWVEGMSYRMDKRLNNSVFMCGASAGLCSLSGFNATYYDRWGTALTLVVPEFLAVISSLLTPDWQLSKAAWLPAGEVVGHAAHIGGFAVGACLGLVWRRVTGRRRKIKRAGNKMD